jgi:hypothetical protein
MGNHDQIIGLTRHGQIVALAVRSGFRRLSTQIYRGIGTSFPFKVIRIHRMQAHLQFCGNKGRGDRRAKTGSNKMKTICTALLITLGGLSVAHAQIDMSCADLLKANAQIDAATKAEMAKDPTAAEMDKKVNDYCTKNPKAKASEAMEKALTE